MWFASLMCFGCAARSRGVFAEVKAEAQAHEQVFGHRVSVWDSPTSQLPRALWTDQAAPGLAPMGETVTGVAA